MPRRYGDSGDYRRRKRRPGTSPLKDAHPARDGGAVITRRMTPEQLHHYRRTGELPDLDDVPIIKGEITQDG